MPPAQRDSPRCLYWENMRSALRNNDREAQEDAGNGVLSDTEEYRAAHAIQQRSDAAAMKRRG